MPAIARSVPVLGDLALVVALVLAGFAVAFGTRHADATEHQDGLMLAISLESVVKLVAFLAVGFYVTPSCSAASTGSASGSRQRGLDGDFVARTSDAGQLPDADDARAPARPCCCRASST